MVLGWLGRDLVARENSLPQNLLGSFVLILLLPFLLVGALLALILAPFARPARMSSREVAQYLRDFLNGTGGEWDIDDFVSMKIADPRLESIRRRFLALDDPADPNALAALIAEAETIAAHDERLAAG